jgi:hypothetical protein
MFLSKFIAFTFFASSASVSAFTTPKPVGIPQIIASSTFIQQEHLPTSHHSFDHSLKFLKNEKEKSFSSTSVEADSGSEGEDRSPDFIAPSIYAAFTGILIYIIYELRDAVVLETLGSKALALVTGALIWDNLIISIGSIFFRDVESNPTKYTILKTLSWPRFTLHAVGTPLQCITVAEMGKAAGVGFLQSDIVQIGVVVASIALAITDRKKFVESPGLTLTTFNANVSFSALERDLVKFTYKEPLFAYVIPAIILALFNLVVGIVAMQGGGNDELAYWLIFSAATALVGNALPGSINTFTGNLGECGMQYGLLQAARIVYGGGL